VDGVSGLNVLTGINAKVFYQQLFEVSEPSILSLAGNQLSVRKHAVLTALRTARSGEIIKAGIERNIFFNLFLNGFWARPTFFAAFSLAPGFSPV
jgi:hypothetical protein